MFCKEHAFIKVFFVVVVVVVKDNWYTRSMGGKLVMGALHDMKAWGW